MSADPIKQAGNPWHERWCRFPHNKQYHTQMVDFMNVILLVMTKSFLSSTAEVLEVCC